MPISSSSLSLALAPGAILAAKLHYNGIAAQAAASGSLLSQDLLRKVLVGRVINFLVGLKATPLLSEIPHPGWVELSDEGNSYWVSPVDYEELLECLWFEIAFWEDEANFYADLDKAAPPRTLDNRPVEIPQEAAKLREPVRVVFNCWLRPTGLTQNKAAMKLGVGASTIVRVLNEDPRVKSSTLQLIADGMGIDWHLLEPRVKDEKK